MGAVRNRHLTTVGPRFWRALFGLILALNCLGNASADKALAPLAPDLPVTNGLIRWWPNLFDARDEITGQEGVVIGVLPPVETGADDPTEFNRESAWVQLQPAITNEVFTVSFWVLFRPTLTCWLIGQESDECDWGFQSDGGLQFFIGAQEIREEDRLDRVVLAPDTWHHVAIARRFDGTSIIWVDGIRASDGRRSHPWPRKSRWLNVGNSTRLSRVEKH